MSEPTLQGQVWENGRDGRYRLWTAEFLPWDRDRVPRVEDGGPVLVSVLPWDVTFPQDLATGFWRVDARTVPWSPPLDAPLDLTLLYGTEDDARRAAYEAGLVAFLISEAHRYDYGLGPAEVA